MQQQNQGSSTNDSGAQNQRELGFTWWRVWGMLSLIVGSLYSLTVAAKFPLVGSILLGLNIWISVSILRMNRTAFLVGTVLSFNPLLWIINGIYLKNRWDHPLIKKNPDDSASSGA